jgi:hypothetical protein
MNPVVRLRRWKRDKAKARLASKLRLQVVEVRKEKKRLKSHLDHCRDSDIWCEYRDSIEYSGKVLNGIETELLNRLKAVS